MRSARQRYSTNYSDEENPYWISFSDIMAGLLVIFVLAAVALIIELTEKSDEWDDAIRQIAKAEEVRKNILREIEEELNKKNIPVKISDNDTVLRIPEDALTFRQGKFNLPADDYHQQVALEIGKVLYDTIAKNQRWQYLDTIFIEGHTDQVPYPNRRIKGNWGLSAFRAITVWDYWRDNLPEGQKLDELSNHMGKKLFSVSGYASTRPVPCTNADPDVADPNKCPEGALDPNNSLQKNRRIDIRFTVRRPALEDYQAIKKALR